MPAAWYCFLRLRGGRPNPAWNCSAPLRARRSTCASQASGTPPLRTRRTSKRAAPARRAMAPCPRDPPCGFDRRVGGCHVLRPRSAAGRDGCAARRRRPANGGCRPASFRRRSRSHQACRQRRSSAAPKPAVAATLLRRCAGRARQVAMSSPPSAADELREIDRRQIVRAGERLSRPLGAVRERTFGLRERLLQQGPHVQAQPVACKARVGVAVVIDVAQAVAANVGVDGLAAMVEPGPRPGDAVARHAGAACRPVPRRRRPARPATGTSRPDPGDGVPGAPAPRVRRGPCDAMRRSAAAAPRLRRSRPAPAS